MYSIDEISQIVEDYITAIRYPAEPEVLYAPISYSMEGGGKRLRPALVLMSCNIFADDVTGALPCAGAIEMFHNFTLLHDDIMDNAEVRRAKPSVHKRWNQNTAILSGDAMVICSYRLLQDASPQQLPSVLYEFNKLAIEVCEGQQYDIDFESKDEVSIDEYMNMIRLKTAVLMAGAAKIGAIAAGADRKDCDTLYDFGLQLGLAYQLQDDYLDLYGTTETLGKNIGGDIAENKKTFLTINALQQAGDATRRAMLATLKDKSLPLAHKIGRIKTIYNSLDIPHVTVSAIESHLQSALESLDKLDVPEAKTEQLRNLVKKLYNRNK